MKSSFDTVKSLTVDILQGNWTAVLADMEALWWKFCGGLVGMMATAAQAAVNAWKSSVAGLSKWMLQTATQDGVMGAAMRKILGVDMQKVNARDELMKMQSQELDRKAAAEMLPGLQQEIDAARASGDKDLLARKTAQLEEAKKKASGDFIYGGESALDSAFAGVDDMTKNWADKAQQALDRMQPVIKQLQAQAEQEASNAEGAAQIARGGKSGPSAFAEEMARLQDALAKMRAEEAAKAAKIRDEAQAPPKEKSGGNIGDVAGTFSAAAAVAMFGGGVRSDQVLFDQLVELRRMSAEQKRTADALDVFQRRALNAWK
jgi:hypothetical protein